MWRRNRQNDATQVETASLTHLPLDALLATRFETLPKDLPASVLGSVHGPRTGSRRGQGLEFEDLRQYNYGDDIRHIDWNVTARTNQPYTRLYREEKEHTTTVIVDLRPCMYTGTTILKSVSASLMAATVLWHASRAGDRCAAIVYSGQGISSSRPMNGYKGVLTACELLSRQFTEIETSRRNSSDEYVHHSLTPLLEWMYTSRQRRGTQYLFSGFDTDLDRPWEVALQALAVQDRTRAIAVYDPAELKGLPVGQYHYHDELVSSANRFVNISSDSGATLKKNLQTLVKQLRHSFQQAHVPLMEAQSDIKGSELLLKLTHWELRV